MGRTASGRMENENRGRQPEAPRRLGANRLHRTPALPEMPAGFQVTRRAQGLCDQSDRLAPALPRPWSSCTLTCAQTHSAGCFSSLRGAQCAGAVRGAPENTSQAHRPVGGSVQSSCPRSRSSHSERELSTPQPRPQSSDLFIYYFF